MTEWVYSTESLAGFVEGAKPVVVGIVKRGLEVRRIDADICNAMIIKNHYSHKTATDSHTILHLGIFKDGVLVGAIQYGLAMNPASCSKIVKDTAMDEYFELNRLWISDSCGKNTESTVIGLSFKLIARLYPKVKWIQSFADGRVGVGTIYQASNFLYCGSHKQDFLEMGGQLHHAGKFSNHTKSFGRQYFNIAKSLPKHSFPQYRYIYFIKPEYRKDLLLKVLPFPKKDHSQVDTKSQSL